MTLAEEMLLRIEINGGADKVATDILKEWDFFYKPLPRQKFVPFIWSEREKKYLKKYYTQLTFDVLSRRLRRTKKAIYMQAFKMGLSRKAAN